MDRYAISDSNVTSPRAGDSNRHQPTVKTRRYYAISDFKTMFSEVTDTTEHRPTSKTNRIHRKYNRPDHKPEVVITLLQLWIDTRFQIQM